MFLRALMASTGLLLALTAAGCRASPQVLTDERVARLKQAAQEHFRAHWEIWRLQMPQPLEAHVVLVEDPEPGEATGTWVVRVWADLKPTMRACGAWEVVLYADGEQQGRPRLVMGWS